MGETIVTCTCGAVYRRVLNKSPIRDTDTFECLVCGERMESWSTSRWPSYQLVSSPSEAKEEPKG